MRLWGPHTFIMVVWEANLLWLEQKYARLIAKRGTMQGARLAVLGVQ
jgi:hypothetical protein